MEGTLPGVTGFGGDAPMAMSCAAATHLLTVLAIASIVFLGADAEASGGRRQVQGKLERDPHVTCLGEGDSQICCRNCTSCCSDKDNCNIGEGNTGWGNLGSDNSGDFNLANSTIGDCNAEDGSYGIGGPDYNGCPEELHNHIVGFCAIYPWYTKCHSPPHYYGGKLIDLMLTEVLKCDDKIPVAPRSTPVPNRQKRTRKAYMPRVKVATSQ